MINYIVSIVYSKYYIVIIVNIVNDSYAHSDILSIKLLSIMKISDSHDHDLCLTSIMEVTRDLQLCSIGINNINLGTGAFFNCIMKVKI